MAAQVRLSKGTRSYKHWVVNHMSRPKSARMKGERMQTATLAAAREAADSTVPTPPRIAFPDRARYPNVIVLDGKVFNMERVHCDLTQSIDSLHDFYRAQFEAYKAEQDKIYNDLLLSQSTRELEHLARIRQRGAVTIPEEMFGKQMIYIDGDLWEVRSVLYEPDEIKGDYEHLEHHGCFQTQEVKDKFLPFRGQGNIIVTVKCPFKSVLFFQYSRRDNQIRSDFRGFHSMSHRELCTNNVPAQRVWDVSPMEFGRYINRINMFSLATSNVELMNLNTKQMEGYHIRSFFTAENIVSIVKEEGTQWRT
jgi:hypothetical protein